MHDSLVSHFRADVAKVAFVLSLFSVISEMLTFQNRENNVCNKSSKGRDKRAWLE